MTALTPLGNITLRTFVEVYNTLSLAEMQRTAYQTKAYVKTVINC